MLDNALTPKQVENGTNKIKSILLENYALEINRKPYTDPLEVLKEITYICDDEQFEFILTKKTPIGLGNPAIIILKSEDMDEPRYTIQSFDQDTPNTIKLMNELLNIKI